MCGFIRLHDDLRGKQVRRLATRMEGVRLTKEMTTIQEKADGGENGDSLTGAKLRCTVNEKKKINASPPPLSFLTSA